MVVGNRWHQFFRIFCRETGRVWTCSRSKLLLRDVHVEKAESVSEFLYIEVLFCDGIRPQRSRYGDQKLVVICLR